MPSSMKNATSIFSRIMIQMFGKYLGKLKKVFVDDLNIHSLSWDEHLEHLRYMLLRLKESISNLVLENVNLQKLV